MSYDLQQKFNLARERALAGERLSLDEQAELVKLLREQRYSAAEAGASARTRKTSARQAKTGLDDADLDAQLDDLGI